MGVRRELGGGQEGVKNVYPSSKSASKTCTLSQKVGLEASKTRTLRQKVRQKHIPSCRNGALEVNGNRPGVGTLRVESLIL